MVRQAALLHCLEQEVPLVTSWGREGAWGLESSISVCQEWPWGPALRWPDSRGGLCLSLVRAWAF